MRISTTTTTTTATATARSHRRQTTTTTTIHASTSSTSNRQNINNNDDIKILFLLKTSTIRQQRRRRITINKATADNNNSSSDSSRSSSSTPYDYEGALLFLGLSSEATSEQIVKAKNDVLAKYPDDEEKRQQVDAAYDVLLMRSFTQRTSGSGKVVSDKIKYADVLTPIQEIKRNIPRGVKDATNALPGLPVFEVGSKDILQKSGVVFGAISIWVLAQGITNPPGIDNPPGFQTALALGASIYFMNKRNVALSRAVGVTVAMLTLGCILGGGVENILRVDIVPLGALSSPSAVVTEFGIIALFVAASSLY